MGMPSAYSCGSVYNAETLNRGVSHHRWDRADLARFHHYSDWCVIEKLCVGYFWKFLFNVFGPQLTIGNWTVGGGTMDRGNLRVVKSVETESPMVVARGWGGEGKEECWVRLNGYRVSVLQGEEALETAGGGCTTMWMCPMTRNGPFKSG